MMKPRNNGPNWLYIASLAPFTGSAGAAVTYFVFGMGGDLPRLLDGHIQQGFVINTLCLVFSLMAIAVLALFWRVFYRLTTLLQVAACLAAWFGLAFFWWMLAVFAPEVVF